MPEDNKVFENNLRKNNDILRLVNALLHMSLENATLEHIMAEALDSIVSIPWLPFEKAGSIFLTEDEPRVLVLKKAINMSGRIFERCSRIPFGTCLCGRAASTGQIIFANSSDQEMLQDDASVLPHSHCCIPLVFNKKTIGVVNLRLRKGARLTREEIKSVTTITNTVTDVIIRKQMEEELNLQRAFFEQLFENSPQAIVMVDNRDRIISINKGFEKLFGYSLEETRDRYINDLVVPSDLVEEAEYISGRVLKGEVMYKETTRKCSDGSRVHVALLTYPIMANGRQVGVYGIYSDITARKLIEKALLESEERYRILFDYNPEAIFVHDGERGLIANNAGLKLLKLENMGEFIGAPVMDFIHPDFREKVRERMKQVEKDGKPLPRFELKFIGKDGSHVYAEIKTIPFLFKGRKAVMSLARDISDRKRAEELQKNVKEKEELLYEALKYEKLRTEFFANISHELRTPLTLMFSVVQMLELYMGDYSSCRSGEKANKHVKTLKQNCYRLLRLINNLIDITKIDTGYFMIELQNQDIVNIVENIALSVAEHLESKGIKLIFDTDVEEKVIACDADKIERIMLNLLSNGAKFTERGGNISVNLHDRGDQVVISVKDTGIGIPEDKLDEVFERFRQIENTLTRTHQGSGIGLSLVKALVEMHGGSISVKSEYGKGSEFIIQLPAVLVDGKDAASIKDVNNKHSYIERINIEFSEIYS